MFINDYRIQRCLLEMECATDPVKIYQYRRHAVDLLAWNIFQKCAPIPGDNEIVVTGYVMGDGKGDWFNMVNTCKHLMKKFRERKVRLIVAADEKHRGSLIYPKVERKDFAFIHAPVETTAVTVDQFPKDADVLRKIKESAAVVLGPIDIKEIYMNDELDDVLEFNGIAINEYDAPTNQDELCGRHVMMGLNALQTIGVYTRQPKEKYSWKTISNLRLKDILFGTGLPGDREIKAYLDAHDLYLCYTGSEVALQFFKAAAVVSALSETGKSIDVCYPCKGAMDSLSEMLSQGELAGTGIGSVRLIYFDEGEKRERRIDVAEQGVELRIIDVGLLTPKDFRILTQISGPLVGCTGDNSLSQALSYGKVPFYEVFSHKDDLLKELIQIIEHKFGNESKLFQFVKKGRLPQSHAEVLQLVRQAEVLGQLIREEHSANLLIQGVVNERIFRHLQIDNAIWEDELIEGYLHGDIPLEVVEIHLVTFLMQQGLIR